MNRSKVLILVPPLSSLGGVALHYKELKPYLKDNVSYFQVYKTKKAFNYYKLVFNYICFLLTLIFKNPSKVVVNLSLKSGFYSKNIYIRVAKFLNKKIIIFIHGWSVSDESLLETKKGQFILNTSDAFIVLSNYIKNKLRSVIGDNQKKILLTTTKVDDCLLKDFDITCRDGIIKKFLFLSRVEKNKGIYLALEIFKLLQRDYPYLEFDIAGDGSAVEQIKQYIIDNAINNVNLLGRLDGENRINAFQNGDLFFLLSESEGMPAALLEAMAFGLPVVTTPVGGIPDFFIDGQMGIMSNSKDPMFYYEKIKKMIESPKLVKSISENNYKYAKEHFYASKVAKSLQNFFNEI